MEEELMARQIPIYRPTVEDLEIDMATLALPPVEVKS
jgi:hypothetical protein